MNAIEEGGHLDEDVCIDLAHGLLESEAAERWLRHASGCPRCEDLFRRSLEDLAEARSIAVPPARRRRRRIRALALAALTIVPLAGLWMLAERDHGRGLPELRIPPGGESLLMRSAGGPDDEKLRAGLAAYDSGDAAAAVRLLKEARTAGEADQMRRIYLASALQLEGRPAEAHLVLDTVETEGLPEPWWSAVRWTRALSFLAEDRPGEARPLLEELAAGKGAMAREARSLLARMGQSGEPKSTKPDQ